MRLPTRPWIAGGGPCPRATTSPKSPRWQPRWNSPEVRREVAARDAGILARHVPDPELDGLAEFAAATALDIDWMRPIHLATLDRRRPVLILTRDLVRPHMTTVTVAPITTTVRGLSTEVPVSRANGLDHDCVVSCDNLQSVPAASIGRRIGSLLDDQEHDLAEAIRSAFDLY